MGLSNGHGDWPVMGRDLKDLCTDVANVTVAVTSVEHTLRTLADEVSNLREHLVPGLRSQQSFRTFAVAMAAALLASIFSTLATLAVSAPAAAATSQHASNPR